MALTLFMLLPSVARARRHNQHLPGCSEQQACLLCAEAAAGAG
jgi:hypothetical protein